MQQWVAYMPAWEDGRASHITVRAMLNKAWYLYILKHTHTNNKKPIIPKLRRLKSSEAKVCWCGGTCL